MAGDTPSRDPSVEHEPQYNHEAVAMLREDPASAGVEVGVDLGEGTAMIDPALVRAAVFNLIMNGAQALGGQGRLWISLEAGPETCRIEVRDSGPGVPPDLIERVFEPFFTTKARGGGLGLAIARRTAEMHDGRLTLACPPEGGTVATLILATRPAGAAAGTAS